jgi:hypothetical protein
MLLITDMTQEIRDSYEPLDIEDLLSIMKGLDISYFNRYVGGPCILGKNIEQEIFFIGLSI